MMMMIVLCLLCSTDWLALAGGWLAVVSTHVSVWPGPGSSVDWQIHKTNLTSSFHNFRSHFILLLLQSSHQGDAIFNIVLPYSVVMETREYYKSRVRVGMEDKPRWRRRRPPSQQQQHSMMMMTMMLRLLLLLLMMMMTKTMNWTENRLVSLYNEDWVELKVYKSCRRKNVKNSLAELFDDVVW